MLQGGQAARAGAQKWRQSRGWAKQQATKILNFPRDYRRFVWFKRRPAQVGQAKLCQRTPGRARARPGHARPSMGEAYQPGASKRPGRFQAARAHPRGPGASRRPGRFHAARALPHGPGASKRLSSPLAPRLANLRNCRHPALPRLANLRDFRHLWGPSLPTCVTVVVGGPPACQSS